MKIKSFTLFLLLSIILPLTMIKTISTVSAYTLTPTITPPILPPPVSVFVNVVSPNGGEYLKSGKIYPITWTSSNVSRVSIALDVGNSSTIWIAQNIPNSKKYFWLVPKVNTNRARITIYGYVSNNVVQDQSNNYFTITTSDICQTCKLKSACPDYCLPAPITD